ncbi:MAG: D-aminoacylase [Betaproteobacteria bacterium]|nr:MAG: D-aminoacylase [Betaproteobacteria bacterium]
MAERFDLIIRNARVIDGTGAPRYRADIGIRDDRIARLGNLAASAGTHEIEATALIAAPGFIDAHTHDDRLLLSDPTMTPKVSQGVTTVITGNCGISLACSPPGAASIPPLDLLDTEGSWFRFASFADYRKALAAEPPAINAACLIGHTTLRAAVMDRLDRPATPAETARMRALAERALAAGALGVSTGTAYPPAAAATTDELIEVCRPMAELGGMYVTHMRNEDEHVIDAMEETFLIGRTLGIAVVISHHKCVGKANHGRSAETLALIERRLAGQQIGLDCYPYVASSTVMHASRVGQSTRVLVTWSKTHPEFNGKPLDEVARSLNVTEAEAAERLKPAGAIYFMMDETDVQRILAYEHTMVGSDGLPHDAIPHPRLWGTFPRVLGHYARDLALFPLEIAVHKMTGLTATRFGLKDRGVLRPGAYADLTLFDPETVIDAATFDDPVRPARGIDTVIVNGRTVWANGAPTSARPGRILAREASV